MAKSIIAHVRSLGGKFLEKDRSCGRWFETGDKRAIEKTERALQERKRILRVKKGNMKVSTIVWL